MKEPQLMEFVQCCARDQAHFSFTLRPVDPKADVGTRIKFFPRETDCGA